MKVWEQGRKNKMEECQRNREASEMDERILMSVFCETFSLKQLLTSIDYKMGGGVSCVLKKSREDFGREDLICKLRLFLLNNYLLTLIDY